MTPQKDAIIYLKPAFHSSEGGCIQDQGVEGRAEADAILAEFRRFFEDDDIKKVWHNYSFDRHVLANMLAPPGTGAGIAVAGFAGDTMHMARLADSSRQRGKGYSLENLSGYALSFRVSYMPVSELRWVRTQRLWHRTSKCNGLHVFMPDLQIILQYVGRACKVLFMGTSS